MRGVSRIYALLHWSSYHGLTHHATGIKVVQPTFDKEVNPNELQTTWLGHAVSRVALIHFTNLYSYIQRSFQGVLVQFPRLKEDVRPITLLIDPIFAERAFPTDKAGPSRSLDPPCRVEDLPVVDFLFISHNQ